MVMWQLWNGARCKFVKPQRAGFVEKLVRCTPVNFYKCFCRLFFVPNAFSMGHFWLGTEKIQGSDNGSMQRMQFSGWVNGPDNETWMRKLGKK